MTRHLDIDRAIEEWLNDGPSQLPDRTIVSIVSQLDATGQRRFGWLPWREPMNRMIFALGGVAAVVVIAALALGLYVNNPRPGVGGPGAAPTTSPSPPSPTAPPTAASPTPIAAKEGRLEPGVYVAHPFGPPNESMSITFSVPSDSWEGIGDGEGLAWGGDSGGVGMTFLRVTSLNGDPCNWSGAADDVEVGPTVDDLVTALTSSDDFETSEPEDVTLGGYSGKKVVVTMPSTLRPGGNTQTGCDEQIYVIWDESNAEGFTIYAQGPENLWTMWILDVEGERLVVMRSEFAHSPAERRQQLDSIVDSIVITAP